ncbi:MAG: hypothetical protein IJP03_01900, partial [Christensenellaceae bacterium]|nr:hypothetical protein [Christensenellaceae bacterium]
QVGDVKLFTYYHTFDNLRKSPDSLDRMKTFYLPVTPGGSYACYLLNEDWALDLSKPVVTMTCVAVGDPTWTWNGTSSATASFPSADGNAVMTVKATVTSSTQPAQSCLEKAVITYTATATANGVTYTDTVTADGEPGPHSLSYSVFGNTATETCANRCGHSAKATLTVPKASYTYTGAPIMPAVLSFNENWEGKKASYTNYKDNKDVGTATVTSDPAGQTVTATFEITPANIADAEVIFDPEHASYHAIKQQPDVSVVWNGMPLAEGTDYTLCWDKTGFTDAGTYTATLTGSGNFTGTKEAAYNIVTANIKEAVVTLDRNTFVYDGAPHKPTAVVFFEGTILKEGVDYELYYVSASSVKTFVGGKPATFFAPIKESSDSINAGQYYAVVFGKGNFANSGSNFTFAPYTIEKAAVTPPTVASKPYSGALQTADIADTDIYTVVKNDGGTSVKPDGDYEVVLELKDTENYKWSTTDSAQVTLPFAITQAVNKWVAAPAARSWTYGKAAKPPVGTAQFGEVSIAYSGTANDGTPFSGMTPPTKAGNYTATLTVAETEDYTGLEAAVSFTVEKADYDMSGAKWDYTGAIPHDGSSHTVEVTGLPEGVTVTGYTGNTAADAGSYTASVTFAYDADNYNAPVLADLNWIIGEEPSDPGYPATGDGSNPWLWDALLLASGAAAMGLIFCERKRKAAGK